MTSVRKREIPDERRIEWSAGGFRWDHWGKANRRDIGAGRAQTCRHGSLQGEEEKRYTKIETEKTRGNRLGNEDAERMGWRRDEVNRE